MAETNAQDFDLTKPLPNSENVNPPSLTGDGIMAGTPLVDEDTGTWEDIKDDLVVPGSDLTALGEHDIEGLENAAALNQIVNPFVMTDPISPDPTDKDLNKNVFDKVYQNTMARIEREGAPNEIQPLRFSIKGSNFDRYYSHEQFSNLGFNPYADNESQYNAVSSWWDENARARSQYWNIWKTGFLSTYKALGDMMEGNWLTPDPYEAEAYADAMRIGNSTQEGTGAFFNNLFLNSAYTVGIMSNIALEEFAMAGLEIATFGGATPLVANRTAYNAMRGGKAIDNLFNVGAYADRSRKLLQQMKNVNFSKDFWMKGGRWLGNTMTPNTLKALKSIKSVQGTAKALSGSAKTWKTFGGMYRDFRAVNLAMAESKLEGGMVKNDLMAELYAEFVKEHGRAPSGAELSKMARISDEASFTTLMLNAPIIYFSNAFIFDTALRGFGGVGRIMNDQARKGVFANIVKRQTLKEGQKKFTYGKNAWDVFKKRGLSGNLKTFTGAALNYGRFNLVEGLQEITQEGIAVGAKDYYRNLYNDPMAQGLDAFWASTQAGAKSQWSGEGFEVFMSGFLMGGLVRGPQKLVFEMMPEYFQSKNDPESHKEYQDNKEKYIKETVDILNKAYENPEHYFDLTKLNSINQKQINEGLFAVTMDDNLKSFQDQKDEGIFSAIHRIVESGQIDNYREQMEDFLKLDDQGLAEAFKDTATKEEIKSGKTRERIEKMLSRIDDIEKAYKELNEKIVNPFNPEGYTKGSKEWNNEVIASQAFRHAKMLALYTRDTFTRALERSNQIYTELSSDPIIKKMAANDIAALASTQDLISEIRLLKIELRNTMEPTKEEGVELSAEEKVIYEKKKERLKLLQDYFSVLTDPNNIEKYEPPTTKVDEKEEIDEHTTIITGDAVREIRANILSTRNITDLESQKMQKLIIGASNPFGIFDPANIGKLKESTMNYLNHISGDEKDSFIAHDKMEDFLTKLVDFKSLKGRAEDYNKASAILINPESLYDLAKKMEAGFWEIFMENKQAVKERMRAHVEAAEKNEFLKQLAKHGIYPEVLQAEIFLQGGATPYSYITEDGALTPEDNPQLYAIMDRLRGDYMNLSKNTMQKKEQEKKEEEETKEEYDPYNFENTHFSKGEDTGDINESNVNKYTGNSYGDAFLVKKHKQYLLGREGKGSKESTLTEMEDWLASPVSKRARVIEFAMKRIHDEIYIREKLVGGAEDSFLNWVLSMKEDPRVSDILRSVDVEISDFIEPKEKTTEETKVKPKKYTVKEEVIRDRETGEKTKVYKVRNEKGETETDGVHTSKKKANDEKAKLIDRANQKIEDETSFDFAGSTYTKGDILANVIDGIEYIVLSTPSMVDGTDKISIKEKSKIASTNKRDIKEYSEEEFKALKLEDASTFDYKYTKGKLRIGEPLAINPAWDYKGEDYIERGKYEKDEILRNLTEKQRTEITFRVTPGPKWFEAGDLQLKDKELYEEKKGTDLKNDLIVKHAQKWQVEVMSKDRKTDTDVVIGYFNGPETVLLLNRKPEDGGEPIDPVEITEAQVQRMFHLFEGDNIKDKTEQIRNNYAQAYHIYNRIDKLMENRDEAVLSQKDLDVVVNITEGQMALADEGDGALYKELYHNKLTIVSKEDLWNPEEEPYYFIDYDRKYDKGGFKEERNIITNIKPNTASLKLVKEQVRKYESKFSPADRLGKYVSFITLPNGSGTFVYTKPQTMSEVEVMDLFRELQDKSAETVDDPLVDKWNKDFQKRVFIASDPGVYIEFKISKNGSLRIDYSDLNIKKAKKGQKPKGIEKLDAHVPAKMFRGMEDIQELLDAVNSKLFAKGKPLHGKSKLKLESFKKTFPKDPTIEDLMNTVTVLEKEVKKNLNFSLSSTENIHAIKRKLAESAPKKKTKTVDDLGPKEKRDAHTDNFSNVDIEILEDVARKQVGNIKLDEIEKKIAKYNEKILQGIRLKISTNAVNSVNTPGEAINQDAVDLAEKLEDRILERKREIRTNNKNKYGNEKSALELQNINEDDIKNDPELQKLKIQLKEAESRANKITKNFDGHDIEDIETYIDWVKSRLGDRFRIDINNHGGNLKLGYKKVGMFMMNMKDISRGIEGLEGVITTGWNNPFKYHEAFHGVFRMLLTDAEIKKYLAIAKKEVRAKLRSEGKTLAEALNEMRKQHSMYAEMPQDILEERYYEEYLADEFEKFKMNPSSTKTSSENKSMFRRIIDFIIEVLTGFRTRKLNYLFEGIDAGKYRNTSIKENKFTRSFDGDAAFKLELINSKIYIQRTSNDGTIKKKRVKNYIPSDQTHEIISGIASLYVQRLHKAPSSTDKNLLMDSAIADWIEVYNPDREFYKERIDWYNEKRDELMILHESLLDQKDDIKDQVKRHINEFHAASDQVDDSDFAEQDEKTTGDYDKSADMFGGYSSLPKRIRHIIATTTIKEKDRYGNEYVNLETQEPIMVAVNPHNVYNGLLKVLSNTPNDLHMFQKAWAFRKNNSHTRAVLDKVFEQLGLYDWAISGDIFKKDARIPDQILDSALYMTFIKGFRKYRVDNIFAQRDKDTKIVHLFAANKKDDAHHTVKQWAETFNGKYSNIKIKGSEEQERLKDALMGLSGLLKLDKINKNLDLQKSVEDLAADLKESSGMNIHPNYILYSIYSNLSDRLTEEQEILYDTYSHIDPLESEAISMIRASVVSGENLYLDNQTVLSTDENEGTEVTYEKGGVKGRLRKIALNNAEFDESVGASTFIDAENNRRHSHQDPTFHLEKIAEMEGAEYISNKFEENVFLEKNMLLNDPRFKEMVLNGKVRPLRIVGSKEESLMLGELDLVVKRGGDMKAKGVNFGKSKPREFILDLMHSYLYNYNRVSPNKTRAGLLKDDHFAIAPTFIRVLEASNTGDFVALPIHKMVDRNKEGINISNNAIKKFKNEIRIEFDRARRFYIDEQEGVDNPYENKERQGKLHMTSTLLTKLETLDRSIKARLPKIGKDQKAAIADNNQTAYLANSEAANYSYLSQGESAIVDIDGESFKMTNTGNKNIADLTNLQKLTLIERLGDSVSTVETDKARFSIDIDIEGEVVEHFVYNLATQKFFTLNKDRRGRQDLTVFEFTRVEDAEDLELSLTETEDAENIVEIKKKDVKAVDRIEAVAKNGIRNEDGTYVEEKDLFDTVFEEVGGEDLIRERLMDEINEFTLTLKEIKAYDKISLELKQGLGVYKKLQNNKTTYDSSENEYWMKVYNLKNNDLDFNIAQIYLNNYINAKSFNQVLLGDQALSLKNFVDAIKRAKMQNAAGVSAATEIYDESVGVMHKNDHLSAIVFEDFKTERKFSEGSPMESMDGHIYITPKGHRHLNFGFNGLTRAQADVFDDIQNGNQNKIDSEFFGGKNRMSHKQLDAIANSMKIVYGDGMTYDKMSATTLTRGLTSVRDSQGNWIAREGREPMHNLLNKMEAEEARAWSEGKGTLVLAIPKSASKMMNMNVVKDNTTMTDESSIDPKNITDLSADYMRLQMVNPSNKIEIVDMRQIKNLITGEHDLNAEVIIDGEILTVRNLRALYHEAAGNKVLNNYFAKRNLTFSLGKAMNALDKVKNINKFTSKAEAKRLTADLHAFVKYARAGLEASQAKTQMLSYFKLDELGNPEYNLNAPMIHQKMEQLFFSFFSKGVIAGRQPGISAALVPDYGMGVVKQVKQVDEKGTPIDWTVIRSDEWESLRRDNPDKYKARKYADPVEELHVGLKPGDFYLDRLRFNVMEYKDGKPTGQRYSEFMMPPHFRSQLNNRVDWNKPLPDAIAKMFGVRIPSQDKHSAVNLKLVDYLPVHMGSSAMYARELVELSGADFDIDKLYMQIKSFFYDGTNFVEYGKVKDNKEGYRHYTRNVLDNATKKGSLREAIDRWLSKDLKVIQSTPTVTVSAEDFNNMDKDARDLYLSKLREGSQEIMIDVLEAIMHGVSPEQKLADVLYKRTEGLPEALEILGLPVTYEEYVAYKEANGREPYEAAIDNKLLDLKFGLLGNSGMTEVRPGATKAVYFEPAVTDPIEEAWKDLKEDLGDVLQVLGENQRDIDGFLGMLEAWTNIRGGQEAIGSVVLPNTTSSVLTEFEAKLRRGEGFSIPTMNGINYSTFKHDYAINHETKESDPSTYRKQFVISALITQATDNAKNPLLAPLNLHRSILPTVVTMLSLGVDLKTIILVINNPSIKEALFQGENKDKMSDPGYKKLIEKRLDKIKDQKRKEKVEKVKVPVNTENLITSAKELKFDRGAENYKYENYDTSEVSDAMLMEEAILEQFITFNKITETLADATKIINLQNGFGSKISEFESFQTAAENLGLTLTNEQFEASAIPIDLRDIFVNKRTLHQVYYRIYREMYDDLTPKVMLKRTPKFVELKDKVLDNLDKNSFKIGLDQKEEISRDIVSYLTLKAYMTAASKDKYKGQTLESLQNSFIYDGNIYGSMADLKGALSIEDVLNDIKMRLDKAGKTNYFINNFTRYIPAAHEDNKSGMDKLEANNWTQFSDAELTRVQNSLLELLTLSESRDVTDMYNNVTHLVHYLALTQGMNFGGGSFINVIPTVLVKDLLNSVDRVHELFLDTKDREGAFQSVFGMSFDDMTDELVRGYLKSKGTSFFLKEIKKVPTITSRSTEAIPTEDIGAETDVLTVDYSGSETATNSQILSNLAYRPFIYKGKQYGSVMHAFEVWKSGEEDTAVDKKYRKDIKKEEDIAGRDIRGKKKKVANADDPSFLLTKLVETSILQAVGHRNKDRSIGLKTPQGSLLAQILISAKEFEFPNSTWMSKATEKGLLRARKNLVYIEQTEEQKKDPLSTRNFMSAIDVAANEVTNKEILATEPVFIDSLEQKLTVDMFRSIPAEFQERIKGIRFLKGKGVNTANRKLRDKHVKTLEKAGFNITYKTVRIGGKDVPIPQAEFPAVIQANGKYYALQEVHRDKAYKKEGTINEILPSDSNIAYGNRAEYVEIDLEGSSTQTRIAFLFGIRPTHNEIVQYGKDKRVAMGEEVISADQEQSTEDAMQKLGLNFPQQSQTDINEFGEADPGFGLTPEDFEEYAPGGAEPVTTIENNDNNNMLSEAETLLDFYSELSTEQKSKLATDPELKITSAKKIVSLLNEGHSAELIMETIKKCYI